MPSISWLSAPKTGVFWAQGRAGFLDFRIGGERICVKRIMGYAGGGGREKGEGEEIGAGGDGRCRCERREGRALSWVWCRRGGGLAVLFVWVRGRGTLTDSGRID